MLIKVIIFGRAKFAACNSRSGLTSLSECQRAEGVDEAGRGSVGSDLDGFKEWWVIAKDRDSVEDLGETFAEQLDRKD